MEDVTTQPTVGLAGPEDASTRFTVQKRIESYDINFDSNTAHGLYASVIKRDGEVSVQLADGRSVHEVSETAADLINEYIGVAREDLGLPSLAESNGKALPF